VYVIPLYYVKTLNNYNKERDTMKTILEFAAFAIGAETILFTIFGIIPELLKAGL